ncbi:cadherin-13-like isoform X4 [Neoarius graeffei]|uniref:cadherin-13-like isoform X4 n=1 Tax=Neoarius graeffei TaxID=443677 RepID=UPI00298CEF17|nr:cadherin-13-like isoform X4 [Neoarius graeffei]
MRTITVTVIILFIMTVGAQEIGSSVSKIRQKRAWVMDIFTIKRGFKGLVGRLSFTENAEDCDISGSGYDQKPENIFTISKKLREIYATGKVNYDDKKFTLVFECASLVNVYKRLAVDILIEETYEPYFTQGTYSISAEESMQQGTHLLTLNGPNSTDNPNLTFNIKVKTDPKDVMFVINEKREISFRGCLDYEENKKYTLVVEAKDQKILTSHSSTATVIIKVIDKNDHKPVITGKKIKGQIKEGEIGMEVYRIQVTDGDSPGSPGWRAKFTLDGEKAENFGIEKNPKTNEGILSVVKPLDYEEIQKLNLTVNVENEEPFFSCSVQKKYTGKLWDVNYSRNGSSSARISFSISVEDVNDPPVFTDTTKYVNIFENTPPGHSLWTFSVTDQDQNPPNKHQFIKGNDINDWVTIDSRSGKVSTAKVLDRESPFVKNSTYTVILHAVDDGKPPKTGTGTLIIQLLDQNDNAPLLKDNEVEICLPKSMTTITAIDPDLPPFTAPFTYEFRDDKADWRIEPSNGETVNLVKGKNIFQGRYELFLNITDSGGLFSTQKLLVTVHKCTDRSSSSKILVGGLSILMILICLLLALCVLLMVFKCSCSSNTAEKIQFPEYDSSKYFVHCYNEEGPGNDVEMAVQKEWRHHQCKLKGHKKIKKEWSHHQHTLNHNAQIQKEWSHQHTLNHNAQIQKEWSHQHTLNHNAQIKKEWSHHQHTLNHNAQIQKEWSHHQHTLNHNAQRLSRFHDQEELCDYQPHPYNNEGEPGKRAQLDRISIADSHFSVGDLQNLDSKFQRLAEMCRPDLIQQSYVSQASLSSQRYHHHHHLSTTDGENCIILQAAKLP